MESKMESATHSEVTALKAHLALNVKSVERSMEFYRRMLGIEPSKVRAGYAKFDVANPPLNLTLNENAFGERGALSHLGIQLASTGDVARTRERWAAAGLFTRDEMGTNCCYAVQDKTWVSDPDGNEWEAFVVLEDNLPETAACCGTTAATTAETTTTEATATAEASSCCAPETNASAGVSAAASCCETSVAPVAISR